MALFLVQAGIILILGCLAMVVVRFIYEYARIVEIVIAFLILARYAAYLIPRFNLSKSERRSAIFPESTSTSSCECNCPGPNRSSWQQDEIQMHLWRLDRAAVGTASSSNDGDHIERDLRSSSLPLSPGEAINRHPSYEGLYEGNYTRLDTRPNGARQKQGEKIQRHLQRLAMAAASEDAGVANASPSLLYQGEGVNIQLFERSGSNTFTRSSSDKLYWQPTREHQFDDTEHFSYSTSPNSSFTGY